MNPDKTLRLSSYTIQVELNDRKNQVLLIHGYTGAVDIVSKELASTLNHCNQLPESCIAKLTERGYLTFQDAEDEYAYVRRIANVLSRRNSVRKKDFTIIVSYCCNFKCPYCFEIERLNKNGKHTLTPSEAERLFDAMLEIEPNRKLHNNSITLFGGEPLLKSNLPIIERIVSLGVSRGYKFTATTNGYDLDSYLHLLNPSKIYGVQVKIDGIKDTHNARRVHSSCQDTFSKIIANIKAALQVGALIKVRVNLDSSNITEIQDLLIFLQQEHILGHKNFKIYGEIIDGEGNFCPTDYTKHNDNLDSNCFIETLSKVTPPLPYSLSLYTNIYNAIIRHQPISLNPQHCGANATTYILDPKGNIYSCHEYVGSEQNIIGTYIPHVNWNKEILDIWHNRISTHIDNCAHCKYALLCGGGCTVKAQNSHKQYCCDNFENKLIGITKLIFNNISHE